MIGLLLKDVYMLRKYLRTLLLICGFYIIWGYAMDNISFVSGFITLLFSMMIVTSFFYDDAAKWNSYALSLPLTRRDLVFSKYLLSLCFMASGFVVSLFSSLILSTLKKTPITKELFLAIGIMLGIGILFQCVMIPVTIKLGTEKARIAMFSIFMVPTLIGIIISKLDIPKPSDAVLHQLEQFMEHYLGWVAAVVLIILFTISYFVSIMFMEQKEI